MYFYINIGGFCEGFGIINMISNCLSLAKNPLQCTQNVYNGRHKHVAEKLGPQPSPVTCHNYSNMRAFVEPYSFQWTYVYIIVLHSNIKKNEKVHKLLPPSPQTQSLFNGEFHPLWKCRIVEPNFVAIFPNYPLFIGNVRTILQYNYYSCTLYIGNNIE